MSSDILLSDQVAYVNESSFFPSLVRKVISEIVFDSTSDKKADRSVEMRNNTIILSGDRKIKGVLGRRE